MPLGGGHQAMDDSHPTDHPTPDETPGSAGHATVDPGADGGHTMAGHATANHADDGAEHGHAGEALGPIDWSAWGAGVAGVIVGLAVAGCFVLATWALPGG